MTRLLHILILTWTILACGQPHAAFVSPKVWIEPLGSIARAQLAQLATAGYPAPADALDRVFTIRYAAEGELEKLGPSVLGMCAFSYAGVADVVRGTTFIEVRWIVVKRGLEDGRLRDVLLHEELHCGYNLDHDEDDEDSLMSPYIQWSADDTDRLQRAVAAIKKARRE